VLGVVQSGDEMVEPYESELECVGHARC
jgi:hypothetical protein